jgi:hypothetical protein
MTRIKTQAVKGKVERLGTILAERSAGQIRNRRKESHRHA